MSELLETPLAHVHTALGARMVEFGGWNMPVQYADGIIAEHTHTRTEAAIFDICHMGEFRVKGPGAAEGLDGALARAVANMKVGICRYNFLLNEEGGVLDDLIVYRLAEDEFYIVVNAATTAADAEILKSRLPDTVTFTDESDATAKIDLQGPKAAEALASLGIDVTTLPLYYKWDYICIENTDMLISRTGYTGELGYEFYLPAEKAEWFWNLLSSIDFVKPAGLGARDTLRLEMGYPLYGHEMDPETTPMEAGFGGMLKPGRTFVGDCIHTNETRKNLVGLQLDGRRAAREGTPVFNTNEEQVGIVTSGSFSPILKTSIAMAMLDAGASTELGTDYLLGKAPKYMTAKVVDMPFYKDFTARVKLGE